MTDNELTLNARVGDLEKQVAEIKGSQAQLNQSIAQGNRLTIWQFISFTLVMAGTLFGTLFGTLAWISSSLREELHMNRDQFQRELQLTREQLQKEIRQSEQNMNDRFTQMEKRFEDLRLVVLSQQRQQPPKR